MPIEPEALPRQFRYWLLHVSLNALPSFIIALDVLHFSRSPGAIVAMLSGIGCVICCLSWLTSLAGPLADPRSLPARALRVGVGIRSTISLLSLFLLLVKKGGFVLDLWLGLAACNITARTGRELGIGLSPREGDGSFLPIFITVLVEAALITFMVAMISFFALLVLQRREHHKMIRNACYR